MGDWEKVERDGKVAVLVSPGYGAGWSTWAGEHEEQMLFDSRFVALAERAAPADDVDALCEQLWGKDSAPYTGGWRDIQVRWVPKGDRFTVEEYDGSERLNIIGPDSGFTA